MILGALDRKLWRDLWRIRGQALAIALVIGCGLSVFVMTLGAVASLEDTKAAYYERARFADVFASLKRAPASLRDAIAGIDGVRAVQTRVVEAAILDVPGFIEPVIGQLASLPERGEPVLNVPTIRLGRSVQPGRPDEAVVNEAFAEAHNLKPGDRFAATLNGKRRTLDIVGVALSPEYVYAIGPGSLMPDDARLGIVWMGQETLEAAFDMDGAFNDVSVTVLRDADVAAVIVEVDTLLAPYGGLGAIAREDQTSNFFLEGQIERLRTIASVMPLIFLAVGAFLLHMATSRLIALERGQIGLLKAFGYGDLAIAWHYLRLVLLIAVLGITFGLAGGIWLGRHITEVYAEQFRFPFLTYRVSPAVIAGAAAISLVVAVLGTLGAVRRAAALPPAEAMRPEAPPNLKGGALERSALVRSIDALTMIVIRHVTRWPLRSGLTTLGIALAVTLLVSSLHWLDAIDELLHTHFFESQRQDVTVGFAEIRSDRVRHDLAALPGVRAVEPFRTVPVRFRHGTLTHRGAIEGLPAEGRLTVVRDVEQGPITVTPNGLLLASKLAEILDLARGERVAIEVLEGRRPVIALPVAGVFETYIGTPAYLEIDALNRLMLEGEAVSGAQLAVDGAAWPDLFAALKRTAAVSAVVVKRAAIETFDETLAETIHFIVTFYVLFAALVTFGVVYNSARIALSERGRELASLRVLGFTRAEISYILLGELGLLTLLALPLGCLLGYALSGMLGASFENELYRLPFVIRPATYGWAVLVVLVAAGLSGLLVRRRLDRLDLVAVLKTRE